jgi:hypothetical protein
MARRSFAAAGEKIFAAPFKNPIIVPHEDMIGKMKPSLIRRLFTMAVKFICCIEPLAKAAFRFWDMLQARMVFILTERSSEPVFEPPKAMVCQTMMTTTHPQNTIPLMYTSGGGWGRMKILAVKIGKSAFM